MIHRTLSNVLRQHAGDMPVVTLIGPRQSGKTTLVREVFPSYRYMNLERPDTRSSVADDPLGFLKEVRDGAILDEVHRVPHLLSYLQVEVDEDPSPGRFILTASQNLLLMERVSQTLAGRTAIETLLPFSLAELHGRPETLPDKLDRRRPWRDPPEQSRWETLFAGFYPRIHDRGLSPTKWLSTYVRTYVERDLHDVLRVMDLDAFHRFLRLAAARTACELNLISLAADAGITQPTARSWLAALQIGSIVMTLPAHHANYRKRLRRRPKLHFLDTGLVCYLLGIRNAADLATHPLRGAIFESFVVAELAKVFAHHGREARLFHWRDARGREIDVLVSAGERLIPVEVKSGMTLTSDALAGLRWWLDLDGNRNETGLLVTGGVDPAMRRGISVSPWFSL